jgi:hypothetical protein
VNAGSINGTILGNSATGAVDHSVAIASGRFAIVFYGPNAEEMGLVFTGGSTAEVWVASGVGIKFGQVN